MGGNLGGRRVLERMQGSETLGENWAKEMNINGHREQPICGKQSCGKQQPDKVEYKYRICEEE